MDSFKETRPNCIGKTEETCYQRALNRARKVINRKGLKKPCQKVQYKVKYSSSKYDEDNQSQVPQNIARFIFCFTKESMTVKEQYVIFDAVAMVGAIGGTLGMCIGFSFSDMVSSL